MNDNFQKENDFWGAAYSISTLSAGLFKMLFK